MKPYVSSYQGEHSVINSAGKEVKSFASMGAACAYLDRNFDKLK